VSRLIKDDLQGTSISGSFAPNLAFAKIKCPSRKRKFAKDRKLSLWSVSAWDWTRFARPSSYKAGNQFP